MTVHTLYDSPGNPPAERFLSHDECAALVTRISRMARGGGKTSVTINSMWRGNVAWVRNQITTCGDLRNDLIGIKRTIRGAPNQVQVNQLDDLTLESAVRRAERLLIQENERVDVVVAPPTDEPYDSPTLWFDRTYQLDAAARASAMRRLVQPAEEAGMFSSGYIEVSAHGHVVMSPTERVIYYPFTTAQYSVTVRDPKGSGSGWAGVDWNDWGRIDAEKLSAIALQKCLDSRNPVAVEPGRYTAILEPQAVCDLVEPIFDPNTHILDRYEAENRSPQLRPFSGETPGESKIGERVIDERITISADPMDPDCSFMPMTATEVYHPVTWIEHGVLKALAYDRYPYGVVRMGLNTGLPNSGAFHMSGGTTSIAEMIATTQRGLLVTRFWDIHITNPLEIMLTGYTRDGVWLIEKGKISKPVKNFRFIESPLVALNYVVQLGVPQRVFRPRAPAVVPPLKINGFNFTSLSSAV